MTYAGLKSMIYAGLAKEDPRVKAALTYITQHYTLDENPGLGQQGLYYYYHTFAKTMAVLDKPTLTDATKVPRLASRAGHGPGQAATTQRRLGQPGRPFHGRRPESGHRLRLAGAGLHPVEEDITAVGPARHSSDAADNAALFRPGHDSLERQIRRVVQLSRSASALRGFSSRSMRNAIWPSSSPTYSLCGQGQSTGSLWKRGMMCQWQWSTVWPAARPLLMITLSPRRRWRLEWRGRAGEVASRCGRRSVGEFDQVGMVELGHDQGVARIDRVDVQEGDGVGRFEHPGRRNLAMDDLAEDAVRLVTESMHARHSLPPVERNGHPPKAPFGSGVDQGGGRTRDGRPGRGLGALIWLFFPERGMTAIGAASPWRTLASL